MGRHSIRTWWRRRRRQLVPSQRPGLVDLVDAASRLTHLITPDALAAGWADTRQGYVALCGRPVVPAPLVEPGNGRRCALCEWVRKVRRSYEVERERNPR